MIRFMALRKIAQIGHPILRTPAQAVEPEDLATEDMQRFIDDLVATMRDANGAGLAAPQVFEPLQVCAVEVQDNPRYPYKPRIPLTVLVNPVIHVLSEDSFMNYEGCLSVPNLRGLVRRHAHIRIEALNRDGTPFSAEYRGFTAGTMQHEIDHLFATLFVDRVEDPKTLTTWTEFERHHKARFMKSVQEVVDRYHRD